MSKEASLPQDLAASPESGQTTTPTTAQSQQEAENAIIKEVLAKYERLFYATAHGSTLSLEEIKLRQIITDELVSKLAQHWAAVEKMEASSKTCEQLAKEAEQCVKDKEAEVVDEAEDDDDDDAWTDVDDEEEDEYGYVPHPDGLDLNADFRIILESLLL
ncbi:hypothetical protein L873DRAFT_1808229 [Choiromyces venosus 120613-1]|uniref:Uncharacterized protein n=1 Tax=Choiromyces venosus 120613-1 TaxID=1336337 RepID=A0A3N4JNK1_9PEZI|nr:hypothetical protein L873DRAFT_1808229 [Choiromyces venosus 120613-1]